MSHKQFELPINYDDFNWNCLTGILLERKRYESKDMTTTYGNTTEDHIERVDQHEILITVTLVKTNIMIPIAFPNIIFPGKDR